MPPRSRAWRASLPRLSNRLPELFLFVLIRLFSLIFNGREATLPPRFQPVLVVRPFAVGQYDAHPPGSG
jgi:hypothetical protein